MRVIWEWKIEPQRTQRGRLGKCKMENGKWNHRGHRASPKGKGA